jgi:para-aminobenzoate synthetase
MNFWDVFSACQSELANRLDKNSRNRNESSKFRGGWIGWFGYEMKEESLAGHLSRRGCKFADWTEEEDVDACWSWGDRYVERSSDGEWTVRGVVEDGEGSGVGAENAVLNWLEKQGVSFAVSADQFKRYSDQVTSILSQPRAGPSHSVAESFPSFHPIITGAQHREAIDNCREAIRQGESYELTLTTRFDATLPTTSRTREDDTYSLYLKLRARNPAYYSTYISFPTLTTPKGQGLYIVSSSPERFLKIDEKRQVEMMPIKGTMARVKPGQCVCTPETGCGGQNKGSEECNEAGREEDARRADWLRNDKKERAENLMVCLFYFCVVITSLTTRL